MVKRVKLENTLTGYCYPDLAIRDPVRIQSLITSRMLDAQQPLGSMQL